MLGILKSALKSALKERGYQLVRNYKLVELGSEIILGSYSPLKEYYIVGRREDYFLHGTYCHRTEPIYYDDSSNQDQYQDEVYRFALEVARQRGYQSVSDIGCGSGFKLLKYFSDFRTIGLDVEETIGKLRLMYPEREWMSCDFHRPLGFRPDLAISSDVIEHLPDPDLLLSYMQVLRPRSVIISTPDRNLLRQGTHNGPPCNPSHIREWSMPQLYRYVSEYFDVVDHFISSASQATQCLLAVSR